MKPLRTSRKGRRKQQKRSSPTLVGAWTLVFLVSVLRVLPCSSAESLWRRLRTASQFHRRSSAGAELVGSKLTNSTAELLVEGEDDVNETRLSAAEKRISALSPATAIYNSYGDETTDDQNNKSLWSRSRSRRKLSRKRARERFLERVALIASSSDLVHDADILGGADGDHHYPSVAVEDLEAVTPQSDLSLPGRHIHIVTTAALPWFTGTAVNPLLRAAYLHRRTQEINNNTSSNHPNNTTTSATKQWVTLVIPWLELTEDQESLYGRVFANEQEQEDFIRAWLREEAEMPDAADPVTGLEILFYPARYHTGLGSIFAMGDIMETVLSMNNNNTEADDDRQLDVCVLEEPEHCNWYRAPSDGWTKRFNYVVGIVHTSKF